MHLLGDHGYRRIAFLNGPETSTDGRQRFEAYKETLEEFGVPIDKKLIVFDGDFYSSGEDAVRTLLDQRRADFDALVAANDAMAIFAMKELQRRGIRVPDDVAVAGFDDCENGRLLVPGLTTVRQSFYDIGRECVNAMLAILTGKKVPRRIVAPTRLVIRESCGCSNVEKLNRILSSGGRSSAKPRRPVPGAAPDGASRLTAAVEKSMPFLFEKPRVRAEVEELARRLPRVGDADGRGLFIKDLEALCNHLFEMKEDLETVWKFIASFFTAAGRDDGGRERLEQLKDLRRESMMLAVFSKQRYQEGRWVLFRRIKNYQPIVNEDFSDQLNVEQLRETVFIQLQKMQFKQFYVFLYTDQSRQTAKPLLLSHARPGAPPTLHRAPFPAKQLLPASLKNHKCSAHIVSALYYRNIEFGYIVFDISDLVVEPVYDNLATQISTTINSAIQAKAIHEYAEKLEDKVKERTRQLEQAARERTDFFNGIAHEINNPLTIISNYLDAYIEKRGMSDELKVLKTNFESLLGVIENYLSREKIESGRIAYRHDQVADFSDIVRNDVILFRESARRRFIRLDDEIDPEVVVAADPEALERVVGNLLQNAIRFTKAGGAVKVSLRRKKDRVEFSVKDTGIGLTSEQMKHIYERYYRAHTGGDGAAGNGLGLYLVKKIIDELGAGIRVTSAKGKGTTFTCGFTPARTQARVRAPLGRAVPATENEADGSALEERGIVLLVEDNAELLAYLVENTKRLFNVYYATDGLDALEKLKHVPKPNIIVSDVLMDKMDGYRFYEELMRDDAYRDVPFVFLSAVKSRADRLKALNQGAVDFITKPFLMEELIAKIKSTLRIQDALKKKNLLFLGSKVYQAIEGEMRKYEEDSSGGDLANGSQLYAKHGISKKEIEVISLLKLGLPHKQIAARLDISINTMRTYLARIYRKCNVNSSLELFAKLKTL